MKRSVQRLPGIAPKCWCWIWRLPDSGEVERLHHEFPSLRIVCTHRLADDKLWTEALNQGASDMCEPRNTEDILRSVMRERAQGVAA